MSLFEDDTENAWHLRRSQVTVANSYNPDDMFFFRTQAAGRNGAAYELAVRGGCEPERRLHAGRRLHGGRERLLR